MVTNDGGAMNFDRAQVMKSLWLMPHKGSPLIDAKKADFHLLHLLKKIKEPE